MRGQCIRKFVKAPLSDAILCSTKINISQVVGDNFDHNAATETGHSTYHIMGSICVVTPAADVSRVIPRGKVSDEQIISVGKIETKYFGELSKKCGDKFLAVDEMRYGRIEPDLWTCAWLIKPFLPMWTGYMDLIHKRVRIIYLEIRFKNGPF